MKPKKQECSGVDDLFRMRLDQMRGCEIFCVIDHQGRLILSAGLDVVPSHGFFYRTDRDLLTVKYACRERRLHIGLLEL